MASNAGKETGVDDTTLVSMGGGPIVSESDWLRHAHGNITALLGAMDAMAHPGSLPDTAAVRDSVGGGTGRALKGRGGALGVGFKGGAESGKVNWSWTPLMKGGSVW